MDKITQKTIDNLNENKCKWCIYKQHHACSLYFNKNNKIVKCDCFCRYEYGKLDEYSLKM